MIHYGTDSRHNKQIDAVSANAYATAKENNVEERKNDRQEKDVCSMYEQTTKEVAQAEQKH
jgi:hypothetical protein